MACACSLGDMAATPCPWHALLILGSLASGWEELRSLHGFCAAVCGVQDYLFQYRAGIEAVTPEDILAAARRHLHPRQQAVVMAADASVFQPQLEAAGMRVVPLTVD